MIHLASTLFAHADGPQAHALHQRMLRNSYEGPLVHSAAEAMTEAKRLRPDIVCVGPDLTDGDGLSLARRIKADPETSHIPVVLMSAERSDEVYRAALEGGVDDVLILPIDEHVLFARMRPLVRLATMHHELHFRADVAHLLGIDARDKVAGPVSEGPPILLVVGSEADSDQIRDAIPGADITSTTKLFEAEDLVADKNFDVAVLFAGDRSLSPYLDLCVQMRNNPRLFNLPVVLAVNKSANIERALPYRSGASRVIHLPTRPPVLKSAILPLVSRQRTRWSIRQALDETLRNASKDPETDVYSRSFLDSYLADRMEIAKNRDRHLSIIVFYVPSVVGVRESFGADAGNHLMRKLSQWINGLLRAEDLTARTGDQEFCVVLPDTPLSEAQVVMHRIAGVLSHTDFAIPDVYEVVQVWVQVGATEITSDDTPDTLLTRARMKLD